MLSIHTLSKKKKITYIYININEQYRDRESFRGLTGDLGEGPGRVPIGQPPVGHLQCGVQAPEALPQRVVLVVLHQILHTHNNNIKQSLIQLAQTTNLSLY